MTRSGHSVWFFEKLNDDHASFSSVIWTDSRPTDHDEHYAPLSWEGLKHKHSYPALRFSAKKPHLVAVYYIKVKFI